MKASTFLRTILAIIAVGFSLFSTASKAFALDGDEGENGRVYVMTNTAAGNTVVVYDRANDGSLTWLQEVSTGGLGSGDGVLPPPLPPGPGPDPLQSQDAMVLAQNGRFLLVANSGSNDVSVLATTHQGLQLISRVPSGGVFPVSIAQNRNLVYVLNEGESPDNTVGGTANIAGFRLDDSGTLNPIANSSRIIGTDTGTSDILFSPAGDTLLVTEMFTNFIDMFPMGADGTPGQKVTIPSNNPTPFGAAFRGDNVLAVSEIDVVVVNGRRQGVANASTISSYQLLHDGSLQTISKSVPSNRTGSCWVRFSRDGRFAYTADTGSGTISIFQVSEQGELTLQNLAISGGAFSAPLDLDITPDGRFLYVLIPFGQIANSPPLLPAPVSAGRVQGFRLEEDGSLTPISTVGNLPFSVQGIVAQ